MQKLLSFPFDWRGFVVIGAVGLLLAATTALMLSQSVPIHSIQIAPKITLRLWAYGAYGCKVTYHPGYAIGTYKVNYFTIPRPLEEITFAHAVDTTTGVQCIYANDVGVVYMYLPSGEQWTAEQNAGTFGSPLQLWREELFVLQGKRLVPKQVSLRTVHNKEVGTDQPTPPKNE